MRSLSDLYNSGIITGEQYLYCVDNDIDTVEQVLSFSASESAPSILIEMASCLCEVQSEQHTEQSYQEIAKEEKQTNASEEELQQTIINIIESSSARVLHVLENIFYYDCKKSPKLIFEYFSRPEFHPEELKNIGRKSIPELKQQIEEILTVTSVISKDPNEKVESNHNATSTNMQYWVPILYAELDTLSVRNKNVLTNLIEKECKSDIALFYRLITSPSFNPAELRNIGRTSLPELRSFLERIITLISSKGAPTEEDIKKLEFTRRIINNHIASEEHIDSLYAAFTQLGHFPLFKAIDCYLMSFPERERSIATGRLFIYNDRTLIERSKFADEFNVSAERVRQLKVKAFHKLKDYLLRLSHNHNLDLSYYIPTNLHGVNYYEGTNYNENFMNWVVSMVNSDYYVIGDPETSFYNPYNKCENLDICKTNLAKEFDFLKFKKDFSELYIKKRYEDESINLSQLIDRYYIKRIRFDLSNDIEKVCLNIIRRSFQCVINEGVISFESNAYRNLPDLIEQALKETGHAMTAEEIFVHLSELYPGRIKSVDSVAQNARANKNIKPIGRSSTYALKEWHTGGNRSGTIREFAIEYLLTLPIPISPIEDIGNYVRRFRPTSSNRSIQSNLLLESTDRFSLYTKDRKTYIGLTSYNYDSSYVKFTTIATPKRDINTSFSLLEEFISTHNRFPFYCVEDEEEKRLSRFWKNELAKNNKGNTTNEEKESINCIITKYGHLQCTKTEFDWKQRFDKIEQAIINNGFNKLKKEDSEWLFKYLKLFQYGRLTSWQEESIARLKQNI